MTPALRVACEQAVHVVKTDGTILLAGRATLFMLSEIGYGSWTRLLLLPPFIWFVEWGYRLMANHRDFFANFLFTRDHSAEAPEGWKAEEKSVE